MAVLCSRAAIASGVFVSASDASRYATSPCRVSGNMLRNPLRRGSRRGSLAMSISVTFVLRVGHTEHAGRYDVTPPPAVNGGEMERQRYKSQPFARLLPQRRRASPSRPSLSPAASRSRQRRDRCWVPWEVRAHARRGCCAAPRWCHHRSRSRSDPCSSDPTQRPTSSSWSSPAGPAIATARSPAMARFTAMNNFRIEGSTGGRSRRRIAAMMRSASRPSARSARRSRRGAGARPDRR